MQTTNGIGARHLIKTKSIRHSLLPRQKTRGTFRPSHLAPHPSEKVVVKQKKCARPSNPESISYVFPHNPYSTPGRLHASPARSRCSARAKIKTSTDCRSRTRLVVNNQPQKLLLCFPVVWSFTLGTKLKPPTAQCFQETRPSFSVSRHPGIPSILTVFATLTTNEIHEQRILYRVPFSFAPVAARRTLKILRLNVC